MPALSKKTGKIAILFATTIAKSRTSTPEVTIIYFSLFQIYVAVEGYPSSIFFELKTSHLRINKIARPNIFLSPTSAKALHVVGSLYNLLLTYHMGLTCSRHRHLRWANTPCLDLLDCVSLLVINGLINLLTQLHTHEVPAL